jgi:acyl carrier protein
MSKPSETTIREWTRMVVHQTLELGAANQIGDATSWRVLGVDSAAFVTIIMDLEDKFGVQILSEDMEMDSVDQAVACIQQKLDAS